MDSLFDGSRGCGKCDKGYELLYQKWMMRHALLCYVSALAILVGCAGTVTSSSSAAAGGSSAAGAGIGGGGGAAGRAGNGGDGGSSGDGCKAFQIQAQRVADTSCQVDGDCIHPPHSDGDCTECGVELNAATEQTSLAAVRAACQPFFAQGCKIAMHSCIAHVPYCDAGACDQAIP